MAGLKGLGTNDAAYLEHGFTKLILLFCKLSDVNYWVSIYIISAGIKVAKKQSKLPNMDIIKMIQISAHILTFLIYIYMFNHIN
jgi:hypothetical protein